MFLITQIAPASCHFLFFTFKPSSQHFVLKNPPHPRKQHGEQALN